MARESTRVTEEQLADLERLLDAERSADSGLEEALAQDSLRDWYESYVPRLAATVREQAAEIDRLRATVEQVLVDGFHADTCGCELSPGAGYPCNCWKADLCAALDGGA